MKFSQVDEKRFPRYRKRSDSGFVLVMVLVSLVVAMSFFLAATRSMLVVRKTIDLQARQAQAECLAESALHRAAAELAADEKYTGETWKLSAAEMAGSDGAVVKILVNTDSVAASAAIHVDAEYPDDRFDRARVSRDFKIQWKKGAKK